MKRMWEKGWQLTLSLIAATVMLAGCGAGGQSATGQAPAATTNTSSGEQAAQQTEAAPAVVGTLSFYTSQPDADAAALIDAFTKKYPDVKVELFRSGTEEVISRLLAEAKAGSVKADVLLVADAPTFVGLKQQDLLLSYQSPEADQIPTELRDPDGTYYGTKVMATAMIVNTTQVKERPDSWQVLADPANSGKVLMPSPLYSGAAAYNLGVLTRQETFGWDFYEQLKANEVTVTKGNGAVLKSVAGGEKAYGMIVDFLAARAKQEGSPVDLIYPKEGVPVITEPIGILKETQNPDAAKAFVDFVLSEEGQKLAASIGYTPIRKGVEPPAGLVPIDQMKILSADPVELEKTREADKKRFGEMMGGN
ncbi:ABC transporter substrate-binding protein [Brevibacillus humidisoli]|uniref:ABC transporter substrate-binding protein n=1 Tax=Brevibacillus humidisoli TaxID=2895522 RepID=UPI001E585382|nr:ABC transporter substrate-binding protein [Brevibacillus humidisoli]UFJ38913.1 ABC transporter substrate-binding protein [Brevibacillus humidisoli]